MPERKTKKRVKKPRKRRNGLKQITLGGSYPIRPGRIGSGGSTPYFRSIPYPVFIERPAAEPVRSTFTQEQRRNAGWGRDQTFGQNLPPLQVPPNRGPPPYVGPTQSQETAEPQGSVYMQQSLPSEDARAMQEEVRRYEHEEVPRPNDPRDMVLADENRGRVRAYSEADLSSDPIDDVNAQGQIVPRRSTMLTRFQRGFENVRRSVRRRVGGSSNTSSSGVRSDDL